MPHTPIVLDKEKYLQILAHAGLSEALTTLHHDMKHMEHETFDTHDGFRPDDWKVLEQARTLSRELWDEASKLDKNGRP